MRIPIRNRMSHSLLFSGDQIFAQDENGMRYMMTSIEEHKKWGLNINLKNNGIVMCGNRRCWRFIQRRIC